MAQQRNQPNSEKISCSICIDLLKDPVSTSCGHSYCMDCIKTHWDGEDRKKIYSCPQCRKIFKRRPDLQKNILLAELVEDLKKTGLQAAAAADLCYAGSEDVACDVCTGWKMKAVKSCLVCLASYCENHLQPHYDSAPLRKHQLVEPSKNLQERICSRHDKIMEIFCGTDQKLICLLCTMDEHKGHKIVPAAAERTKKQKELEVSRLNVQQRIQDRQKDVKLLQQELEDIKVSADKTAEDSEKMFAQMILLIQNRSSEVEQQIRSQQKTEESRVKELQGKLQQEIRDLKRKDTELKQLSETPDHSHFLHNYRSVSALRESTHSSSISIRPRIHLQDVAAAVKVLRGKLEDILKDTWTNISPAITQPDVLLSEPEPEPEPKTRDEFLKYSREITLDPNTAHRYVLLSAGNRKAILREQKQRYPDHPDRFTGCWQVLSKESLTGRCYWEVEWSGLGVIIAVAYKNICRKGNSDKCEFGRNDKSWSLRCGANRYKFLYNNRKTPVSGPRSSRIGVYLDHRAGILSFYSISETMTLLHRVQTTFTGPIHAGVYLFSDGGWLFSCGATAEFLKLR